MTFEQLRVFVAVAEREHLTRAAAALHLTPSAVSSTLSGLEQRYGLKLFHRVGRRIELSSEGQTVLVEARQALAAIEAADLAFREVQGLVRGRLVIAASQTLINYWLPRPLLHFAQAHPAVEIDLQEGNTTTVAQALRDGRCELGFIEGPIDDPALRVTPIDDDQLVVVASPDHPLVRLTVIAPDDLAASRWIMRETGSGTRDLLELALRQAGIDASRLRIDVALPTNEAICAAVRGSDCLSAVSTLTAQPHIEAGRLRAVRFPLPARQFAVARHKERYQTKAARAFITLLEDEVRMARARRDPLSYDI
jgi:DNA-binding transcriptional LysR family regulator